MSGTFLQSKQMVFGADKKLAPTSEATLPELHMSGTFKGQASYGQMMNHPGSQAANIASDFGSMGGAIAA